MREINKIAEALFEKIRARFEHVSLGDDQAHDTSDPEQARFFNFDYVVDGKNHGNITVSLQNERSLKIFFSKNITKDLTDHERQHWYAFLRDMRAFAKRNILRFEPRDITRASLKYRDVQQAAQSDNTHDKEDVVTEARMYGTTRSSYEDRGPVRIIIRHKSHVDPDRRGDRSRKIGAIYLQNQEGERFKLPHNSLRYARAMCQHMSHGGTITDDMGQHITQMAQECTQLSRFNSAVKRRFFEDEDTQHMVEASYEYHGLLKNTLERMGSKAGYAKCCEQFTHTSTSYVPDDQPNLAELGERFVKRSYNDRIQDALPLVHKAYNMKRHNKLTQQFESWATVMAEGTWALPESDTDITELKELLSAPLPVGADAENATNALSQLIGDDKLYDELADLAQVDAQQDARNTILAWIQKNLPDVYAQLDEPDDDTSADNHSETEHSVSEAHSGEKDTAHMTRRELLDMLDMDAMTAEKYSNTELRQHAHKRALEMTENQHTDDMGGSPYEMGYRAAALHHKSKHSNPFDMMDPSYDVWEDGWREGAAEEGLNELDESGTYGSYGDIHESPDACEAVQAAIIRRIINQHKDVLAKYGPQAIMNAAEDEAENKGDIEEIGTSDVSGWVQSVIRALESGQYGDAHSDLEEDYGQSAPADSASPLTHAHEEWCDACDCAAKHCQCDDKLEESFMAQWNSFLSEDTDKEQGVAEDYDDFDDEDEESGLRSGGYVRDKEDSSGEVFIMRGDPYDRRVQITDRNGSGWNISPSRLVAVDDSDPAIARYFGKGVAEATGDTKFDTMMGQRVYVKSVGEMGTVSDVSMAHRNSLIVDLDNGDREIAHFTDLSKERPGLMRRMIDRIKAPVAATAPLKQSSEANNSDSDVAEMRRLAGLK